MNELTDRALAGELEPVQCLKCPTSWRWPTRCATTPRLSRLARARRALPEAPRAWKTATGNPVIGLTGLQSGRNMLAGVGVDHAENTASFLGHVPGQRGALAGVCKQLAATLTAHSIRVNIIHPHRRRLRHDDEYSDGRAHRLGHGRRRR